MLAYIAYMDPMGYSDNPLNTRTCNHKMPSENSDQPLLTGSRSLVPPATPRGTADSNPALGATRAEDTGWLRKLEYKHIWHGCVMWLLWCSRCSSAQDVFKHGKHQWTCRVSFMFIYEFLYRVEWRFCFRFHINICLWELTSRNSFLAHARPTFIQVWFPYLPFTRSFFPKIWNYLEWK